MRFVIAAVLCALLIACAGGPPNDAQYRAYLESHMGTPERELIRQWGVPDSSYALEGEKYLRYRRFDTIYYPNVEPIYVPTARGTTLYASSISGPSASAVTRLCETTFVLKRGRVVDYGFSGNDCRLR